MSVRKSLLRAVLGTILASPILALAHHSHGNYDLHNYTYLNGTVQELVWLNPHTWIHLRVMDAGMYFHDGRLYILEATVPAGALPQGPFQQSLSFLDADGNRIRYQLFSDGSRKRVL